MGIPFSGRIGINMTRFIKNSIPVIAAAGLIGFYAVPSQSQAPTSAEANIATVNQYCVGCHSDKLKTAGVTFEHMTVANIAKDPELFE